MQTTALRIGAALACVALMAALLVALPRADAAVALGRATGSPTPTHDPGVLYMPRVAQPQPTPIPTATALPTPQPTVTPTRLEVRSSRYYRSGSFGYVVGDVFNGLASPVYFAKLTAGFYDSGGHLLATASGYTLLTRTPPGQRVPFRILLSNAPEAIATYTLDLDYQTSSFLDYRWATIVSQQARDNFGAEVFGELRNDQARELRSIAVAVTFLDAAGQVYDVEIGFPSSTTLAPGATSLYRVSTYDRSLVGLYAIVQAEGYVP